jgi:hypothetical protein
VELQFVNVADYIERTEGNHHRLSASIPPFESGTVYTISKDSGLEITTSLATEFDWDLHPVENPIVQ